jgi:hypothetical protein
MAETVGRHGVAEDERTNLVERPVARRNEPGGVIDEPLIELGDISRWIT